MGVWRDPERPKIDYVDKMRAECKGRNFLLALSTGSIAFACIYFPAKYMSNKPPPKITYSAYGKPPKGVQSVIVYKIRRAAPFFFSIMSAYLIFKNGNQECDKKYHNSRTDGMKSEAIKIEQKSLF